MAEPLKIYVIGAGGHARVVAAACLSLGKSVVFVDRDKVPENGCSEADFLRLISSSSVEAILAIGSVGSQQTRRSLVLKFDRLKLNWTSVFHPQASISETASIAEGTFLARGAIVADSVQIGRNAIVNTGAIVDHDTQIGEGCHIATGAALSGGVRLGRYVHVGTSAAIIQGVSIADGVVVGAGAVVTKSIDEANSTWVGVPARMIKTTRAPI